MEVDMAEAWICFRHSVQVDAGVWIRISGDSCACAG